MKPKLDYYLNKLLSRKFQVLAIAVILFLVTDKFDADSLVIIMCAYMGFSVAQKFAPPNTGG
jgi:hypothetical protein